MDFDPVADELTVGTVAELVGVSVRTLHHWDQIGLVTPSGRTPAGYRRYGAGDIGRIYRVLVYRELGFSLSSIIELIDDPDADEERQLRAQRRLLEERIEELRRMAAAVDELLGRRGAGEALTAQVQAEIFGTGWRQAWADEAQDRWGGSEQWRQFEENAAALTSGERRALQGTGAALLSEMAEAKRAHVEPSSAAGIAFAERHREMIGRLFACSPSMHVLLGRLFVEDPRFRAGIDDAEPGMSVWLNEAIRAAARANGVDPRTATWA